MSETETNNTAPTAGADGNTHEQQEQQQEQQDQQQLVPAADNTNGTNSNALAEMHANAIECAQSRRSPREAQSAHSSNAVRYLLGISNTTKAGDVETAHDLVKSLEEEDRQLFSEIPRELKPRKQLRTSDGREGSMTRRAEYYNANYSPPDKHEDSSPRRIVDIRRPLTARYDPLSPEARRSREEGGGTSRYRGLAKGDLSSLENDPIYSPSPNSRRKEVEAAKDKERSQMVKPHSAAQLARRRGPPAKEKTVEKKSADWYPALANLAENRNTEGKQRRQEAQARMSTHTFK